MSQEVEKVEARAMSCCKVFLWTLLGTLSLIIVIPLAIYGGYDLVQRYVAPHFQNESSISMGSSSALRMEEDKAEARFLTILRNVSSMMETFGKDEMGEQQGYFYLDPKIVHLEAALEAVSGGLRQEGLRGMPWGLHLIQLKVALLQVKTTVRSCADEEVDYWSRPQLPPPQRRRLKPKRSLRFNR